MIGAAELLAGAMLCSLIAYALLGGADFGGGVWDLLATGERAERQRAAIAEAIAPIWEANHVWLILVVVLLFSAFPPAFALMMTALHLPVTLLLIGIVLRGSSFVFRRYDTEESGVQRRWGRIFAASSFFTPILLGIVIGAISTPVWTVEDGVYRGGFVRPWLRPFPIAVGLFALAQFAFLAATYLTVETKDPEVREDFRRRALLSAIGVGGLAFTVVTLAGAAASAVARGLLGHWWSWPLQALTAAAAVGAIVFLWRRRFLAARVFAAAQVSFILLGWGLAMNPYLVADTLTIHQAAAPPQTLRLLIIGLTGGAVILFPAFWYLFRTFKGGVIFAPLHDAGDDRAGHDSGSSGRTTPNTGRDRSKQV